MSISNFRLPDGSVYVVVADGRVSFKPFDEPLAEGSVVVGYKTGEDVHLLLDGYHDLVEEALNPQPAASFDSLVGDLLTGDLSSLFNFATKAATSTYARTAVSVWLSTLSPEARARVSQRVVEDVIIPTLLRVPADRWGDVYRVAEGYLRDAGSLPKDLDLSKILSSLR
jgi:hypothetical protein